MGASLTLPIGQGRLALGVWQVGEQTHVGVGQTHVAVGQTHVGEGQTHVGVGQTRVGVGQTHVGVGQAHVGMGQGAICHVRHPGWAAYTHL